MHDDFKLDETYNVEDSLSIEKNMNDLDSLFNNLSNDVTNINKMINEVTKGKKNNEIEQKNLNDFKAKLDKERYTLAVKNINEFKLQHRITIINDDALYTNIEGKYDLIFIDAAKSQYIKFFEKYEKNLNEDGVIVTDNLSFHGLVEDESKTNNRNTKQLVRKIKKYIDYLNNNDNYTTSFYKLGDGIAISKRK